MASPSSSAATTASASATTSASITATSAATTSAAEPDKFSQLGVDNLLGLGQDRHQIFGFRSITGGEEGVAGASVALASSATLKRIRLIEFVHEAN